MNTGVEFSWTILAVTECQSYQFSYLFISYIKSNWRKIIIRQIYYFLHTFFFLLLLLQIQLDHFAPMEGALSVHQLRTLEMLPVLRMGVQGPLDQDNPNKTWQLQGTIIRDTNLIHMYTLNYILLSSKHFKYFTLHNCMKNEKSE